MPGLLTPSMEPGQLTEEDICILRLALSDGEIQERAWAEWREMADFDALDTGSILIPAAYEHTARHQAEGPVERMRGAYRKNWLLTQLLQDRVSPLFDEIAEKSLDCVLGDDFPLAIEYFPDASSRPVFEVALYCPDDAQTELFKMFESKGFSSAHQNGWHLTDQAVLRVRKRASCMGSARVKHAQSLPLPILDPTAQLCSTLGASRPHPLMRFLDLGAILRANDESVAWEAVGEWAVRHGRIVVLQDVLRFYIETIGLHLPRQAHDLLEIPTGSKLGRYARSVVSAVGQRLA